MKKIISFTKRFGISALSLTLPLLASAQGTGAGPSAAVQPNGGTTPPYTQLTSVQTVLNYVCLGFDYAFWFLIAFAVIFGVIAAFKYLTAAGEPEKVKSAGNTLLYAAIAVAVALLARAIPVIIGDFLGASSSLVTC